MLLQRQAGFFLLSAAFLFLRGGASGLSNLHFSRQIRQYDSWHLSNTHFLLSAHFCPDPSAIGLDLFLDLEPPGFQERLPVPKKGKNFVTVGYISDFLPKKQVNTPGFLSTSEPMARRPPQVLPPPQRRGVPAPDRGRDGSHPGRIVRVLPGGHDGLGPVKNNHDAKQLLFSPNERF